MRSTRIECPAENKLNKLEVCPLCHLSPCQCRRGPLINRTKIKALKKHRRVKNKAKEKNIRQKGLNCINKDPKSVVLSCHSNKLRYLDSCTQELINFCWLLLTPDNLNRLKELLHYNHGYSIREAEEYLEKKQTEVVNSLRLMAVSGKITPFGCNVMNFLLGKTMCRCHSIKKRTSNCLNCCSILPPGIENNAEEEDQCCVTTWQLQTLFEKLVEDIRNESSRSVWCSSRFMENNTPVISQDLFTPWQTSREPEKETICQASSSTAQDCSINYDECFRCLKKILSNNYYQKLSVDDVCSIEPACRCTRRSCPSKSNNALLSSCCKPIVKIVKDEWIERFTTNMKTQDTQTIPKKLRTKSVQTDLIDNDVSVQTQLSKSYISVLKDDTEYKSNVHIDSQEEDKYSLDDLLSEKLVQGIESHRSEPSGGSDFVRDLLKESSKLFPKSSEYNEEPSENSFFETPICDEDSNQIFHEARSRLKLSLDSSSGTESISKLNDKSEFRDARDTCETETRTSVSIIRRPSDIISRSYHTPPEHTETFNRVQFNVDFNQEELLSQIFDIVDDEDSIVLQDASDCFVHDQDEIFHPMESVSGDSLRQTLSYHFNRNLKLSEFPYNRESENARL